MSKRAPAEQRYHHGDLRAALLERARAVVEDEGADELSLRSISRSLGVDAAAAYRHYRNKSDLLAAVAAVGFLELREAMRNAGAAAARPPADRLCTLGRAYAAYGMAHPRLYRLMFGGLCTTAQIRAAIVAADPGYDALGPFEILSEVLDELWSKGALAPTARQGAEFEIWCAMHGLVSLLIDGRGPYPAAVAGERVERHLRTLVSGWRPAT